MDARRAGGGSKVNDHDQCSSSSSSSSSSKDNVTGIGRVNEEAPDALVVVYKSTRSVLIVFCRVLHIPRSDDRGAWLPVASVVLLGIGQLVNATDHSLAISCGVASACISSAADRPITARAWVASGSREYVSHVEGGRNRCHRHLPVMDHSLFVDLDKVIAMRTFRNQVDACARCRPALT